MRDQRRENLSYAPYQSQCKFEYHTKKFELSFEIFHHLCISSEQVCNQSVQKLLKIKIYFLQITVVVPPASSPTITGGRSHYKPGVKIRNPKISPKSENPLQAWRIKTFERT